jgi:hypothetical protein
MGTRIDIQVGQALLGQRVRDLAALNREQRIEREQRVREASTTQEALDAGVANAAQRGQAQNGQLRNSVIGDSLRPGQSQERLRAQGKKSDVPEYYTQPKVGVTPQIKMEPAIGWVIGVVGFGDSKYVSGDGSFALNIAPWPGTTDGLARGLILPNGSSYVHLLRRVRDGSPVYRGFSVHRSSVKEVSVPTNARSLLDYYASFTRNGCAGTFGLGRMGTTATDFLDGRFWDDDYNAGGPFIYRMFQDRVSPERFYGSGDLVSLDACLDFFEPFPRGFMWINTRPNGLEDMNEAEGLLLDQVQVLEFKTYQSAIDNAITGATWDYMGDAFMPSVPGMPEVLKYKLKPLGDRVSIPPATLAQLYFAASYYDAAYCRQQLLAVGFTAADLTP